MEKHQNPETLTTGPSWWPIILAIGIALTLVSLVLHYIVTIVGLLVVTASLVGWLREAQQEYTSLPGV